MATAENTPRVWFVTGATSGIGRELVRQALDAGEPVTAIARSTASLADLGPRDLLLAADADVRDEAAMRKTAEEAAAKFGRIDVVANNAGYGLFGAVEEATDAQARAIFDTNVFGALNVLRATLPFLRAQRSGHILQGSSYYGQSADPGVGLLSATKYALEGLSDALAAEVAPLGIKVTIVEPGLVATPFLSNLDVATTTKTDYDQTVREVQKAVGALPPSAFSPADRIAASIRAAVTIDNPPLRLSVGADGTEHMRAALTVRLADLDKSLSLAGTAGS
jgi:NAD(P)-dependent dehydrogenase (short-subunit alcohol dehydrogenase family)